MSILRNLFLTMLILSASTSAFAEGFAMTEWSARGLSLAGGMVGRADDVSTLAYNPAGITQLEGTHMMAGASFIAPYGSIQAYTSTGTHMTSTKPQVWVPPHAYISHQLNDSVWLGFGTFSRFGLGNSYSEDWVGRYSLYTVGLQSFSAVPTIAYKFNDMFSLSVGAELMYMSMYQGTKIDMTSGKKPSPFTDNDMWLEGSGMGVGAHVGLHAKFNEQWSAGLTYKSQVTLNMSGRAEFKTHVHTKLHDGSIHGTIQLPDSIALGITYKPLDNLSFEVGSVFTRWSTYNSLNIFFEEPTPDSLNNKDWKDGWNFNASVEYAPLDWLTLRAGYWHETAVTNEKYADFLMPTNGRDVVSLGVGLAWENWTVDLAYAHLWVHPTDYSSSNAHGIGHDSYVSGGHSSNVGSDIYSVSIGYTF